MSPASMRPKGAITRAVENKRPPSWNDGDESRAVRRPVASAFESALWTLEEMAVSEASLEDASVLTSLVASVRRVVGATTPEGVLAARTPTALHAALLVWQDHLEAGDRPRFAGERFRSRTPYDPELRCDGPVPSHHELVDERLERLVRESRRRPTAWAMHVARTPRAGPPPHERGR